MQLLTKGTMFKNSVMKMRAQSPPFNFQQWNMDNNLKQLLRNESW